MKMPAGSKKPYCWKTFWTAVLNYSSHWAAGTSLRALRRVS